MVPFPTENMGKGTFSCRNQIMTCLVLPNSAILRNTICMLAVRVDLGPSRSCRSMSNITRREEGCVVRRAGLSGELLRSIAAGIDLARIRTFVPLTREQTAPYAALCGCTVTIVSESSPCCGQSGRVCRVFWRNEPWVLVRLQSGVLQSFPWRWTNLPNQGVQPASHGPAVLLSPRALLDLVRFLRRRNNGDK